MYVPKHFEETRVEVLHGLIRAHPFATLVTLTLGGLDADHIPFEVDPEPAPFGTLRGHVARANPVWRDVSPGAKALVIFQGPDRYISPSWYPTKTETGKVVPTWNYAVVHAHGVPRFIDDRAWLRAFVEKLTNRHEAERHKPWHVTDAPADYIDNQVGAIIGLEIPITRLIGQVEGEPEPPRPGPRRRRRRAAARGRSSRRGDGRPGSAREERVTAPLIERLTVPFAKLHPAGRQLICRL